MSWKLPLKTDYITKEMEHEPTREYSEEIFKFVSGIKYNQAMEVGCIWAISTLSILYAGEGTLKSVDPIPQTNERMHAWAEVRLHGLEPRWSSYYGRSEKFFKENTDTFDLIYIDGSHLYDDVKNDLANGWSILIKGGHLLIDDYLHEQNVTKDYGVSLAVLEFMYNNQVKPVHMGKHVIGFKK